MNYQWILLALFLIALISGVTKALFKPMLKSALRLGAVVVAFLVTFILQLCGVFQGVVSNVATVIDLSSLLSAFDGALEILLAIVSTLIGPLFFVTTFLVIMFIIRIVLHFVLPNRKKDESGEKPKKVVFPKECLWKRLVSLAAGAVSGLLVLGVLLMPMFYLMSVITTVTHATDESDAKDSQIYQVVDVVDTYIAAPYEESFVAKFYHAVGISDLMNYTTKAGGKITLENGEKAYADDTLKNILAHGVSAMAQMTSVESECPTLKADLHAMI